METILIVLVVTLLLFLIFDIYKHISTKKMFEDKWGPKRLDDKFVLENIIFTRSSLRGLYGGLVIITSVLALLGIRAINDIKTNVGNDIKTKIDSTYNINLDSLAAKAEEVNRINAQVRNDYASSAKYLSLIRDASRQVSFFVVRGIPVKANDFQSVAFKNLKTEDGHSLPVFQTSPNIMILEHNGGVSLTKVTKDSIHFSNFSSWSDAPISFDLWVYNTSAKANH